MGNHRDEELIILAALADRLLSKILSLSHGRLRGTQQFFKLRMLPSAQ